MDESFFADLEKTLTHVGVDVYWKRTVGDVELWIAPLTMTGQGKVVESIESMAGGNVLGETKKVTLSHAIVGIGPHDLRDYRDGVPAFPGKDREGKPTKLTLDKFLNAKMAGWGSQFVDDAFSVYADLMESFQRANLKAVKFENTKEPREELADLMVRVMELRAQLGMPTLVEAPEPAPEGEGDGEPPDEEEEEEDAPPSPREPPEGFDPFRQVDVPDRARQIAEAERGPFERSPPPMAATSPIPAAAPRASAVPPGAAVHRAMPSVPDDVIEQQSPRAPAEPPPIDRPPSNLNPRFKKPGG